MAHLAARSAYRQLVDRLNRHPQGAPPSELLYGILALLFTPREAELVARLPLRPFSVEAAARAWGVSQAEAEGVLDRLASRAILLDFDAPSGRLYVLPPPMAGFFEFSMMRVRTDVDQKALAELLYQYLDLEDEFVTQLFGRGETQLGRVFVHEPALTPELSLEVLDYERASAVVKDASAIAVGLCYCRHKMQHLGRACDAPMEICMTFGDVARSLARHGFARPVDAVEGLDLLQQARERGLVQFGENVRERVSFVCNCCGCCCQAMLAARRIGFLRPVATTGFLAEVEAAACNGCGLCVAACPVDAVSLVSRHDPSRPKRKLAVRDQDACLGCGVCVRACRAGALRLVRRPKRVVTPLNGAHRAVLMAIERGCLQNLVFDSQAHRSHRAMAAILGVILRLPPVKQALASRQLRSRYLETLLRAQ